MQLPGDWRWDDSIRDFAGLAANVERFAARQSGGQTVLAMLGQVDRVREAGIGELLADQRPDGLPASAVRHISFWGNAYHPVMTLLKNARHLIHLCLLHKMIPPHPMGLVLPMAGRPGAVRAWLDTQPWKYPWGIGNIAMDTGLLLLFEWKVMGNAPARDALEEWFDWHDENQDPASGFWDPAGTGDMRNIMAGGMHQMAIYWLCDRPLKYPERAARTTIALQCDNGLFNPPTLGQNCLDIDAAFVMTNLYHRYGVCEGEIERAMERMIAPTLKLFVPEGGVVNRGGVDRQPDWWSTQCRVSVIGWASRMLGITEFADGPWDFTPRGVFLSESGGKGLPPIDSDAWYDAVDWPRAG
jgi:hypothetical protein